MPRCVARKADGTPCERIVKASSEPSYCFAHDPDKARQRKAAARAGASRGTPGLDSQAARCRRELWRIARDVEDGEIGPKSGAVLSQLHNTILRSLSVERDLIELGDLQARLHQLEEARKWG